MSIQIRPELGAALEKLAESTHRSQSDLASEAIELYIKHERLVVGKIETELAQAKRGEFVPDQEIEAFFARRTASDGT